MKRILFFLVGVFAWLGAVSVRGGELSERLPGDVLGFLEVDPTQLPATGGGDPGDFLDMGLETLQSLDVLPAQASAAKDVLGIAAVAGSNRWCVGWLDADFAASENNDLECRSVQVVWLIDMQGKDVGMVERLTGLLSHVATRGTAQQKIRSTAEGHLEYVEFRDESWPAWLTLAWTQRDNVFVVALGQGAMEHFLSGRAVGGVSWAQTLNGVDGLAGRKAERGPLARLYISPRGFREKFPEVMARTALGRMFASLDLGKVDEAVLTTRLNKRAMTVDAGFAESGKLASEAWTAEVAADSPLIGLVPKEATAYLILNMRWGVLYERLTALLDASLGTDKPVAQVVDEYAAKVGVDVRRDVLGNLEPLVVVHDAPRHPLRLPLMVTIVAASVPGKEGVVKGALEKLTGEAETALAKKAGKSKRGVDGSLRIRTDKDDISYLQFGLVGPAWTYVENRLVSSWSPGALRSVLPTVKGVAADAFHGENGGK